MIEVDRAVYAQESFRIEVQLELRRAMEARNLTSLDVALKLGVSEGQVCAYFSDGYDMKVRELAQLVHAIGGRCVFSITGAG